MISDTIEDILAKGLSIVNNEIDKLKSKKTLEDRDATILCNYLSTIVQVQRDLRVEKRNLLTKNGKSMTPAEIDQAIAYELEKLKK